MFRVYFKRKKDLDNLERWSHKWDMEFNPSKCQVIHITRSKNPIPTQYTLHNCILESVSSAKYLGVDISSDLSWVNRISKNANNTLRRNIKIHPESLKSYAYKVLVRPQLVLAPSSHLQQVPLPRHRI